jgi:hypothetical protein
MWSFPIVVFDEFPVELESRMFQVVGSEPSFNLTLRCGFTDSSKDMVDPTLLAVGVEHGFSFPYAPELAAVICEYLSGLRVFMNSLVEEVDHVLRGSFIEYSAAGHEAAVVVEDSYQPFWAYKL